MNRLDLEIEATMNLGDIFVKAFLVLLMVPTLVLFLSLAVLRQRIKISWGAVVSLSLVIGMIGGILLNYPLHRPVFVTWHRMQNRFVPQSGCLTYSPDFARLYATYSMTLPQFNAWVAAQPWGLKPGSGDLLFHDSQTMGFEDPQLSFESDSGANGKQLRVYYKAGVMHLFYNSM